MRNEGRGSTLKPSCHAGHSAGICRVSSMGSLTGRGRGLKTTTRHLVVCPGSPCHARRQPPRVASAATWTAICRAWLKRYCMSSWTRSMLQPPIESWGWFCNSQRQATSRNPCGYLAAKRGVGERGQRLGPAAEQGLAFGVGLLDPGPAGRHTAGEPQQVAVDGGPRRLAQLAFEGHADSPALLRQRFGRPASQRSSCTGRGRCGRSRMPLPSASRAASCSTA